MNEVDIDRFLNAILLDRKTDSEIYLPSTGLVYADINLYTE